MIFVAVNVLKVFLSENSGYNDFKRTSAFNWASFLGEHFTSIYYLMVSSKDHTYFLCFYNISYCCFSVTITNDY